MEKKNILFLEYNSEVILIRFMWGWGMGKTYKTVKTKFSAIGSLMYT